MSELLEKLHSAHLSGEVVLNATEDCRKQFFSQLDTIEAMNHFSVQHALDSLENYVVLSLVRHGNGTKKKTHFKPKELGEAAFTFNAITMKTSPVGPVNPSKKDQPMVYVRECQS